jgi:hypothetical protein
MKRSDVFKSKYMKAKEHPDDWSQVVVIETTRMEDFKNGHDTGQKLVAYFQRVQSGLVIGPTIFDEIVEATGQDDTANWKGCRIELYRAWTQFQGDTVPCIRVRQAAAPAKKPTKKSAKDDKPDNEIGF